MIETTNKPSGSIQMQPAPLRQVAEVQQPCTLEDIVALLEQSAIYSVDAAGGIVSYLDICEMDLQDVSEYHCGNCGTMWTVGEGYKTQASAWQAASVHLSESERT